jgi:hypothetical protein
MTVNQSKGSCTMSDKVIRTTGQRCRPYVTARQPFTNSNGQLFARYEQGLFVVYSYGAHWPLYIYDGAQWLENSDRASMTTSKHRSQARPSVTTTLADCRTMKSIIDAAWERRAAA